MPEILTTAGDDVEGVALAQFGCENRLERFKGRSIRGAGCSVGQRQQQDAPKRVWQALHGVEDIGGLACRGADDATGMVLDRVPFARAETAGLSEICSWLVYRLNWAVG